MKKGGKRVFSLGGKSLKNRKKSKRRSKRGGANNTFTNFRSHPQTRESNLNYENQKISKKEEDTAGLVVKKP